MQPSTPRNLSAAQLKGVFDRALALHRAGKLTEAERGYAQILGVQPRHPETLLLHGALMTAQKRYDEAIRSLRTAVAVLPASPEAHFSLADALVGKGNPTEAVVHFRRAAELKPTLFEAFWNLGTTSATLQQWNEAAAAFERAAALAPKPTDALNNASAMARKAGRLDEAIAAARRCLVVDPANAEALQHLAGCLLDLKPDAEARRQLRALTESAPNFAGAWMNLGTLLLRCGETTEAESAFRRAVLLAPNSAPAHQHLGNFLATLARYGEAMIEFDRVLAIDPALHPARLNRGLMKLVTGDLSGGWPDYEARLEVAGAEDRERFAGTMRWRADQSLAGKTLLVHAEQGVGDAIQFIRYVPLLAAKGAKVLVELPPSLKPLLAQVSGAANFFAQGEPVPPFHVHIPMLSLPLEFATELGTIPPVLPVVAAPEKISGWAERMAGPDARLRVGFVWSGNATHVNDRNRSIPLATFRRLIDAAPDCRFFSLQKNPTAPDADLLPTMANGSNLGPKFHDFTDTAAAIANLDLVITVDTSIAHLAGTMGRPVWILLPLSPDWRWLTDRCDSPWYPSATLFRQKSFGDWRAPLAEIGERLRRLEIPHVE